ncbi:sterol desaturase family protein [Streptomyces sp. NPDC001920]
MTTDTSARTAPSARGTVRRGDAPPVTGRRLLDGLLHVHPAVAAAVYGPLAAGAAVASAGRAEPWALAGWAGAGYVAWTLTEYWGHRLILHFEPERGLGARLHYVVHGVHHDYPQDVRRSVLSPLLSVPMTAAAFAAGRALDLPPIFAAGFVTGCLLYDMCHLYLHHGRPRNRLLRGLRSRHMRHHHRDDSRGFGISAPYWDALFGTSVRRGR